MVYTWRWRPVCIYICKFPHVISLSPYIYYFHICPTSFLYYLFPYIRTHTTICVLLREWLGIKKDTHNRAKADVKYSVYFYFTADFTTHI